MQEPPNRAPAKAKPSNRSDVPLPDGEGKDLTKRLCSTCHGTDVFARQRHTKERWNQIIDNMTSKGMEASDDDLEKMATYLAAYLGPDSSKPGDQPASKPPDEPAGQPSEQTSKPPAARSE